MKHKIYRWKNWLTLAIYVLIFVFTTLSGIYSYKKYFHFGTLQLRQEIRDFDSIVMITIILGFLASIKELLAIIPVIESDYKKETQKNIIEKRIEAKIEAVVDPIDTNDKIHVYHYFANCTERTVRSIGDDVIGTFLIADMEHEITIFGEPINRNKISALIFDCYSDFPLLHDDLKKYLSISCYDLINDTNLRFRIARSKTSNRKIEIIVDLGRIYKKDDLFKIRCCFLVPFALNLKGEDFIFSNACYKIVEKHEIQINFKKQNAPEFVRLKILDGYNNVELLLEPSLNGDFATFSKLIDKAVEESKLQLEFER